MSDCPYEEFEPVPHAKEALIASLLKQWKEAEQRAVVYLQAYCEAKRDADKNWHP